MPLPALLLAVVAIVFFALPLLGLLWRAPWSDTWTYLTDDAATTALRLSLVCSLWATALSMVFGVPLAWLLARSELPGRGLIRARHTFHRRLADDREITRRRTLETTPRVLRDRITFGLRARHALQR